MAEDTTNHYFWHGFILGFIACIIVIVYFNIAKIYGVLAAGFFLMGVGIMVGVIVSFHSWYNYNYKKRRQIGVRRS